MERITIDDFKTNTKEWLLDELQNIPKENVLQTISNLYNELHKPQYPNTYEECCKVLRMDSTINHVIGTHFRYRNRIMSFIKLLICRDAYWQIAGEQMGLGKPWEPDWTNYGNVKYVIGNYRGEIYRFRTYLDGTNLAFPTQEMRDVFYENFKDLIEECKEFL
jgi:hypothetical protein